MSLSETFPPNALSPTKQLPPSQNAKHSLNFSPVHTHTSIDTESIIHFPSNDFPNTFPLPFSPSSPLHEGHEKLHSPSNTEKTPQKKLEDITMYLSNDTMLFEALNIGEKSVIRKGMREAGKEREEWKNHWNPSSWAKNSDGKKEDKSKFLKRRIVIESRRGGEGGAVDEEKAKEEPEKGKGKEELEKGREKENGREYERSCIEFPSERLSLKKKKSPSSPQEWLGERTKIVPQTSAITHTCKTMGRPPLRGGILDRTWNPLLPCPGKKSPSVIHSPRSPHEDTPMRRENYALDRSRNSLPRYPSLGGGEGNECSLRRTLFSASRRNDEKEELRTGLRVLRRTSGCSSHGSVRINGEGVSISRKNSGEWGAASPKKMFSFQDSGRSLAESILEDDYGCVIRPKEPVLESENVKMETSRTNFDLLAESVCSGYDKDFHCQRSISIVHRFPRERESPRGSSRRSQSQTNVEDTLNAVISDTDECIEESKKISCSFFESMQRGSHVGKGPKPGIPPRPPIDPNAKKNSITRDVKNISTLSLPPSSQSSTILHPSAKSCSSPIHLRADVTSKLSHGETPLQHKKKSLHSSNRPNTRKEKPPPSKKKGTRKAAKKTKSNTLVDNNSTRSSVTFSKASNTYFLKNENNFSEQDPSLSASYSSKSSFPSSSCQTVDNCSYQGGREIPPALSWSSYPPSISYHPSGLPMYYRMPQSAPSVCYYVPQYTGSSGLYPSPVSFLLSNAGRGGWALMEEGQGAGGEGGGMTGDRREEKRGISKFEMEREVGWNEDNFLECPAGDYEDFLL